MGRLFLAFLFKLRKDLTFRITLIIGAGVAVFMTLLYFLIDQLAGESFKALTGQTMLLVSMSPVQNYGFAIPINLINFIILEFTQGTIRNKIIAGNSKLKIFFSLYLSGLVFAFALISVYLGLCTLLGTIFGGFDLSIPAMVGVSGTALVDVKFILLSLLVCAFIYAFVTAFAVFIATLFRVMGPAIPIVVITLMIAYFGGFIVSMSYSDNEVVLNILRFADPLYALSGATYDVSEVMAGTAQYPKAYYEQSTIIGNIVSCTAYSALFLHFGAWLFIKRDVK